MEECADIQKEITEISDKLLTPEEMSEALNVKVGTLKDWTKLKEDPCPCYRYKSRILRFDRAEVFKWFREQTVKWK